MFQYSHLKQWKLAQYCHKFAKVGSAFCQIRIKLSKICLRLLSGHTVSISLSHCNTFSTSLSISLTFTHTPYEDNNHLLIHILPMKRIFTFFVRRSITIWCPNCRYTDYIVLCLLGFSCFAYVGLVTDLLVWSNPNKSNRRSTIKWYFPLWTKWGYQLSLHNTATHTHTHNFHT